MKNQYLIFKYIIFSFFTALSLQSAGQAIQTSYFMDSPYSHKLNPALQPHRGYIGIPMLTNICLDLNAGTSYNKIFYPLDNSVVTFLHPDIKKEYSIKDLFSKKITLSPDISLDVLSFGFYLDELSFISFDVGAKLNLAIHIPRGILEFLDKGSRPEPYSFEFGFTMNSYMESALGYSRKIDDRLTVGAKLKYLMGIANVDFRMDDTKLTASEDVLKINFREEMRINIPKFLQSTFSNIISDSVSFDNLGFISGHGGAVDMGASYKLLDNLTLHASLTDIGFIAWKKDYYKSILNEDSIVFEGVNLSDLDALSLGFPSLDSIKDKISISQNKDGKGRTTWLHTTFTLGGEYTFFDKKLGAGLLYRAKITSFKWFHEITTSLNYRPYNNLSASLSYSVLQGYNAFGLAFNYRPAYFLNVFIGMDYIPLAYARYYIPLYTKAVNLQFGLTIPLAKKKNTN